ncbi:MAG: imelysin family protein [Acidimicrobiales bacterium]
MTIARAPLALLASAAILATSCAGSNPDRSDVLADIAGEQIIPAYDEFLNAATGLEAATEALCAEPTPESLQTANAALADARWRWSYTEAMWVGPVMERRAWATIDWPVEADEIEELIADSTIVLDQERLSQRIGADQRGLGAVEYVLGDEGAPATLTGRRCEYLTGIATVIVNEASFLPDDWTTSFDDGVAYRETFSASDGNGLDSLVNDSLFLLEAMVDAELGNALGAMEGQADPEAILEGPAGLGTADLQAHLAGLRAVYLGDDGTSGLSPLLGDDLTTRLTGDFDTAETAVDALASPLRNEVEQRPEAAANARDELKAIQTTIATEVVANLGVTIGFSDADGDTG